MIDAKPVVNLSHYRVGPTKTSDGRDAVIYAIYPGQFISIHGAARDSTGSWMLWAGRPGNNYLLPNATPTTTVARWLPPDGSLTVSDTEREGWTKVEVPGQPVRDNVVLGGCKDSYWYPGGMDQDDTHLLTLPTEGGDLICGEYRDGAGNTIKVEKIK